MIISSMVELVFFMIQIFGDLVHSRPIVIITIFIVPKQNNLKLRTDIIITMTVLFAIISRISIIMNMITSGSSS